MSYYRQHRFSKKNPTGAAKPPFASFNPHVKESPVQRTDEIIITFYRPRYCKLWNLCKLYRYENRETKIFISW